MKEVTQGTLIYGLRAVKYPGLTTYGIIITAACDLAQDKVDKVFYLTAIPLKDWLYSDVGFRSVTTACVNGYKQNILSFVEEHDLEWDTALTYSKEDVDRVCTEYKIKTKQKNSFYKQLQEYRKLTKGNLTPDEKSAFYSEKPSVVGDHLGTLFSGANSHYVFVPAKALAESIPVGQGLIVDLLELDYFPIDWVAKIAAGQIDCRVLSEEDMSFYDNRFVLSENDGFSYPSGSINHPWREYVLQHFSNCFIRIGVNNPEKSEINGIVDTLLEKEEKHEIPSV